MEWPNELVLEFLDYYESEPIIWNPSLPNHKNRNEVYDAWKRIEDKLGNRFSVTDLKKKKDSLMASFRTCMKKVKESNKSGAGTCDVFKPNWFAYEKMERFLKDKNLPRQTLSTEVAPPEHVEETEEIHDLDLTEDTIIGDEEPEQGNEAIILPTRATSFKPPARKRFRTADEIELKKKIDGAYAALQTKTKPQTEKNVCDIFGELVAAKLKPMDEHSREVCMHRIENILFEMKMSKGPTPPGNTFLIANQPMSPSTSNSATSPPAPDDTLTVFTVTSDSDEHDAVVENVVVCTDSEINQESHGSGFVGLAGFLKNFK